MNQGHGLQVCILAGGLGRRLRPITDDLPKPMVRVGRKPFLQIQLEHFASLGYRMFILSVGHLRERISEHFGDGSSFGWSIRYAVEPEPLGTGGAALWAQPLWKERAIVANGDTYLAEDWRRLEEAHRGGDRPVTMGIVRVEDCRRFGRVEVEGETVTAFREKGIPGPGWINGGVYLIERSAFDGLERGERFSLEEDLFPALRGRIGAYRCGSPFADIGTPGSLAEFRRAEDLREKWREESDRGEGGPL